MSFRNPFKNVLTIHLFNVTCDPRHAVHGRHPGWVDDTNLLPGVGSVCLSPSQERYSWNFPAAPCDTVSMDWRTFVLLCDVTFGRPSRWCEAPGNSLSVMTSSGTVFMCDGPRHFLLWVNVSLSKYPLQVNFDDPISNWLMLISVSFLTWKLISRLWLILINTQLSFQYVFFPRTWVCFPQYDVSMTNGLVIRHKVLVESLILMLNLFSSKFSILTEFQWKSSHNRDCLDSNVVQTGTDHPWMQTWIQTSLLSTKFFLSECQSSWRIWLTRLVRILPASARDCLCFSFLTKFTPWSYWSQEGLG